MNTSINVRSLQMEEFLYKYFKGNNKYELIDLPQDASARIYKRIISSGQNFILMDCPPSYTSIEPYIAVNQVLRDSNLQAPHIFDYCVKQGFILQEDFGSSTLLAYIQRVEQDQDKQELYFKLIDLLIFIQKNISVDKLSFTGYYTNSVLESELSLFLDFYIPWATGKNLPVEQKQKFYLIWQNILSAQSSLPNTFIYRDFHVENIMFLEGREQNGQITMNSFGLIDFQDALIGSPVYDLVSILQDARISVTPELAQDCINYYCQKTGYNQEDTVHNYYILGAQRNLRVLGVFARKALQEQNDSYIKHIPRVLKYLSYSFAHDIFVDLRYWLQANKVEC